MIKNSVFLLLKLLVTMVSSLYISRVALNAMGVVDFGIYNVVYGSVIMLSLLTSSLSAGVTRFVNFSFDDNNKLNTIYTVSIFVHIIMIVLFSIFMCVFAEDIVGSWLNINIERLEAAETVLLLSLVSFTCALLSVTYIALIIAHEDIKYFSFIGILQAFLKVIGISLLDDTSIDQLVFYSFCLSLSDVIVLILYFIYSNIKYKRVKLVKRIDINLLKELGSFITWNAIGSFSKIMKDQGVNILLNIFFGAAINAARAVSFQAGSAVSSIVNQLLFAVNPRITKYVSRGEIDKAESLVFVSTRFTFYISCAICVFLYIRAEDILELWLLNVPELSDTFLKLFLLSILIDIISNPLITLILATGKIKKYQILVGFNNLLNLPICLMLLYLGHDAEITFFVSIILSISALFLRVFILVNLVGFDVYKYIREVIAKCFIILSFVLISALGIQLYIDTLNYNIYLNIVTHLSLFGFFFLAIVFFMGISKDEKLYIINKLKLVIK